MDKIHNQKTIALVGETTKLSKAATGKESLRTTIPMNIVRQWNLSAGDEIDWTWEVVKGEMIVRIKRK